MINYRKNFYQILSNDEIFEKLIEEKNHVGYYQLPYEDTSEISSYARSISKSYIVVVGIGGSSLGARAIYEFLRSSDGSLKQLVFLDTVDPLEIKFRLKNVNLEDTQFVFISKSGDTIEVISLLKYLNSLIKISSNNATVVSEAGSNLSEFALANSIKTFEVSNNVGGRFSVFSSVGLVPLAMAGVGINSLLSGCREVCDSFFEKSVYFSLIMEKAKFIIENKTRFHTNVIFAYASTLNGFNDWYIQLWAESLGKINVNGTRQGLTPVGLIGPGDQHSFLQLIIDGVRDKTVTFITIRDMADDSVIPNNHGNTFHQFGLDYVDGISFNDLLNRQAQATIESLDQQGDVPYDVISLTGVDEKNIASLMFMYQLLTSCVGLVLQINTYDQPGVEAGKKILKSSLV